MTSLLLLLLAQAAPTPAPSPTPSPTPTQAASIGLPLCLARPFQDAKGATRTLAVVVRPDTAPALLTGGFTVTLCSAVKRSAAQYRQDVCTMAGSGNSAVQARLESVLGVAPALLCGEATSLGALLATVLPTAG